MGYFYDNLDRLASPDYSPTQQDILFCRKTTKGIHEFDMDIEGVPFKFVDVGGQRTQRQRWFQVKCYFALNFVISLITDIGIWMISIVDLFCSIMF